MMDGVEISPCMFLDWICAWMPPTRDESTDQTKGISEGQALLWLPEAEQASMGSAVRMHACRSMQGGQVEAAATIF